MLRLSTRLIFRRATNCPRSLGDCPQAFPHRLTTALEENRDLELLPIMVPHPHLEKSPKAAWADAQKQRWLDASIDKLRGPVLVRPSPWRLNGDHADLTSAWLDGWVAAACEQEPALAAETGAYRARRLAQAAAGELAVTVDHADLLVLP